MDGQDPGTNQRPALQVTSAMQSLVPGDWDDDQAVLKYVQRALHVFGLLILESTPFSLPFSLMGDC